MNLVRRNWIFKLILQFSAPAGRQKPRFSSPAALFLHVHTKIKIFLTFRLKYFFFRTGTGTEGDPPLVLHAENFLFLAPMQKPATFVGG